MRNMRKRSNRFLSVLVIPVILLPCHPLCLSGDIMDTSTNPADGAEICYIPTGEFVMGSDDGPRDERLPHRVTLNGYWIYRTEVTCAQFAQFLEATRYRPGKKVSYWSDPAKSRLPAMNIRWVDAETYCRWAGTRLPTEAEWEKAARGPEGLHYPYGAEYDPTKANIFGDGLKPVGSYPVNGFGLYDMSGNVWEWCLDWYDPEYYKSSPTMNPTGPATGGERVLRGGAWINLPEHGTATFRYRYYPRERSPVYGFRCVKDRKSVV